MIQYYRHPRDVVGNDPQMLHAWNDMPGDIQLRLLESNISISTLGELKMLHSHLEHSES